MRAAHCTREMTHGRNSKGDKKREMIKGVGELRKLRTAPFP